MPDKMRAVQVPKAQGPFEIVERAIPEPEAGQAKKLGAWRYIDSTAQDPAEELRKLGSAKVILATVGAGDAMAAVLGGLGLDGTLMVIGVAGSMTFPPSQLIGGRDAIKGWYAGMSIDSQDRLNFSVFSGVRPMTEIYPLEKAAEAYEHMRSGKARFRVVLTTGS